MIKRTTVKLEDREKHLKDWLQTDGHRLGMITSIDGEQLITLALATDDSKRCELWETPVTADSYRSLTPHIPQCHWYERLVWDMFGLRPEGHPRLKHNLLHEPYDPGLFPLRKKSGPVYDSNHRQYHHLEVKGKGVYELPVGPIHAGIIEPGHFRFSCLGEIVVNLEIRLGYVHRGVEKRLVERPWQKARYVAESAAGDMAVANALAHAVALESLWQLEVPLRAQKLRTVSLELERIAMHIIDIGGIAGDIGFLAIQSTMARLRGAALGMADLLAGTRFQKSYVKPGGVAGNIEKNMVAELKSQTKKLREDLKTPLAILFSNQVARERMQNIGILSEKLARDFGVVGIAARASGIAYDTRQIFAHGVYPELKVPVALWKKGDVYCRTRVRADELRSSLDIVEQLLDGLEDGEHCARIPEELPADAVGLGIVESHRGELIHLVFTNEKGNIQRYAIKDPSINNWTALAITVRNNLVSDFPLCNKSFSLSYSGHDL